MSPPPQIRILAVLLTFTSAACAPSTENVPAEDTTPSTSRYFAERNLTPRDTRTLFMELPDSAPDWQRSDDALVTALRQGGYIAVVAIKEPASRRTSDATTIRPGKNSRLVRYGVRAAVAAATIDSGAKLLEAMDVELLEYFRSIGAFRVRLSAESGPVVARLPLVDFIEPQVPGAFRLETVWKPTGLSTPPAAASFFAQTTPWGIAAINAPATWSVNRGSTAKVLLLDSGIENGHEDLPVLASTTNCPGAQGGCDDGTPFPHGTAMAGIVVGRDNTLGIVGAAPDISATNFYSYGACSSSDGTCSPADIVAGLDWAMNNLYGPAFTVNMSLGSCTNFPAIANAVAAADADGFVLIAAAGNLPNSQCGPGSVIYPAGYSGVVGVSGVAPGLSLATNLSCVTPGGENVTGSSNYGAHVDLTAPFLALSTQIETYGTYREHCGTSQATAHVSAIAALVRAQNPGWSNSQVRLHLQNTARDLGPAGRDDSFGFGLIDGARAFGIIAPTATATIVSQKPRLAWAPIPGTGSYRIYRRVNPGQTTWTLWGTVTGTSYTDVSTKVSSFYGFATMPPSPTVSVSYAIAAVTTTGYETGQSVFATFIPIGTPPQ